MKKIMKEKIFSMLEDELKRRKRLLNDNKYKISALSREQKQLKLEWKEINDFLWELRKTK